MSNTRTTKITGRLAAIGAIGALALGAAAVPAFAAGPGGTVSASVAVPSTLTFSFLTSPSFTLVPGVTSSGAVQYMVSSNDTSGYSITQAAPNLTGTAGTIPATDLSEVLSWADAAATGTNPAAELTNSPGPAGGAGGVSTTGGDTYSEDWTATIPGSTPAGTFSTTITYVAAGN